MLIPNHEQDAPAGGGCGRNCLGNAGCCLPVSKLPLYAFKSEQGLPISPTTEEDLPAGFFLNTLLLGHWEDRMNRGLFRYDVTTCATKVIPGPLGFIAQLNEGRHLKKRPTEFRVDRVLQPFDLKKFNFTKVGQEEVLFRFEAGAHNKAHFSESTPVSATSPPNVVAINVSPIEYGHVLLIPEVFQCLPQRIDSESFLLAVQMAVEAWSPYFRLGYNSLGAFATINHLHFQAYYLSMAFPVEKAPTKRIPNISGLEKSGVNISMLCNYPVRGLVYEGGNTLKDLADLVAKSCISLQDNNIPFNVLISDSGKRIFVFPQCYAEKQALGEVSQELLDTQVNPAVWQISGHMVLKQKKDYDDATEDYAWRLLAEVSISECRFQEVKDCIFEATGLVESKEGMDVVGNKETSIQPAAPVPSPHFPEGCLVIQ